MEQIAVAVQRGNANIMMQAANRQRRAMWSARRPTRRRPLPRRSPAPADGVDTEREVWGGEASGNS